MSIPTGMSLYDALKIRWELKQDTLNGVVPARHANTYEVFLATAILAEQFEKTEKAQVILEQIRKESSGH